MRRRDALAILGLGVTACTPRRSSDIQPIQPSTGPVRVGAVPMRPVNGASGGTISPRDPTIKPPGGPARTTSEWRRLLANARGRQISRLRDYAARRVFPIFRDADRTPHIHHRELTDREPVFIDDRGVHCAVGYLMDQSGWGDAAKAIARSNNNVYVEEVEDGALIRWIEVSGLTQQEAAFIQPSYDSRPAPSPRPVDPPPPPPDRDELAAEVARLVEHFNEVDQQLRDDSDISLEEAMHRLAPRLKAGARVGEIR